MKRSVILITILTAVLFYTCSENASVFITPAGPFTISGTIENWTLGSKVKLKALVYDTNSNTLTLDSTFVSSNGSFTLKPKMLTDSILYQIAFSPDTSCVINVTINPPNTRASNFLEFYLFRSDSIIGHIYRSNYREDSLRSGQFSVYYVYLNQSVRITGSEICSYPPYFYDTLIYEFSGTGGWNKPVWFINSFTKNSLRATFSATEPSGGKWYAHIHFPILHTKRHQFGFFGN